jgi:hypothetical protein
MSYQPSSVETTVTDLVRAFGDAPPAGPKLVASTKDLERWGIRTEPSPLPFYVPPTLACTARPTKIPPLAQLVSAPAAVGKTTLAKHLQDLLIKTGRTVLYVPLQHAKIGDRYLAGLLSEAFPSASKTELFELLFNGTLVLLFDGYDEVSMTTWQIEMNRKFINEVVESFEAHRPAVRTGPCIVFLYRSVFAETGIFEPITPYSASYQVHFFTRPQRREYLRGYLKNQGQRGEALVPLVNEFLSGFERQAEGATPQEEAFFGHAIVLSAFGDFLLNQEEGNAYRLAQELKADGVDEASSVTILRGVIDTILNREAGKFPVLNSLQPLLGFTTFDRDFQEHLLSELAAGSPTGRPVAEVHSLTGQIGRTKIEAHPDFAEVAEPARLAAVQDYLENLRKKVGLHPFLDVVQDRVVFRNPIYREYFVARYAAGHPGTPLPTVMGSDGGASYYLALFLLSLVDDRDLSGHTAAVFFILRLLSAACREDDYQIEINYDQDKPAWLAHVASNSLHVSPFKVSSDVLLDLSFPADAVFQNFTIDGGDQGLVTLSGVAGYDTKSPIMLSQGVVIGAELELDAAALTFDTLTLDVQNLTFTERLTELRGLDTLNIIPKDAFELKASEYARNRWGRDLAAAVTGEASSLAAFQGKLKKVFLWFRKHGRAEYGAYRPRYYTCATNKRQDAVAMKITEFLFSRSILEDGQLIILNQDRLAEYDVYYAKQNELKFGSGFSELFDLWRAYDRETKK